MPEAIDGFCMKITACDNYDNDDADCCSSEKIKNGDYCDCEGSDFVSGWLQSFEFRPSSTPPEERFPDDEDVDVSEYGTMTVDMNGRVYEFAMERSYWSDFTQLLSESKRGGASAGSTWNAVKDGDYADQFGYDDSTVIELE